MYLCDMVILLLLLINNDKHKHEKWNIQLTILNNLKYRNVVDL